MKALLVQAEGRRRSQHVFLRRTVRRASLQVRSNRPAHRRDRTLQRRPGERGGGPRRQCSRRPRKGRRRPRSGSHWRGWRAGRRGWARHAQPWQPLGGRAACFVGITLLRLCCSYSRRSNVESMCKRGPWRQRRLCTLPQRKEPSVRVCWAADSQCVCLGVCSCVCVVRQTFDFMEPEMCIWDSDMRDSMPGAWQVPRRCGDTCHSCRCRRPRAGPGPLGGGPGWFQTYSSHRSKHCGKYVVPTEKVYQSQREGDEAREAERVRAVRGALHGPGTVCGPYP